MKLIFTKPVDRPLNREEAWGCWVQNQLMWPGLGTWAAGRKIMGALQMALSFLGAALAVAGFVWYFTNWFADTDHQPSWDGKEATLCGLGMGWLFLVWLWSLADSISIIRKTVRKIPRRQ